MFIHGFQFRGEPVYPTRCVDAIIALAAFLARVTPESTFMAYHPLCELLKNQGNQINCTNANIQAAISEQSAEQQALP